MDREELYRKYGPMLTEAIVLVTLDEINALREALNLPLRTKDQVIVSIGVKLATLEKYSWMNREVV
jgi:hypothetical protein